MALMYQILFPIYVFCIYHHNYYLQIISAAKTLAKHPGSKIARENVDVFGDAWVSQINDLSVLVKDVNEVCQGKSTRQVYLSLPRPGVSLRYG